MAYHSQLVQDTLVNAAFLNVDTRRLDHLMDDL